MPRILTIPEDFNVIYVEGVPHTPEEYRRLWGGVDLDACPEPPITPLGPCGDDPDCPCKERE